MYVLGPTEMREDGSVLKYWIGKAGVLWKGRKEGRGYVDTGELCIHARHLEVLEGLGCSLARNFLSANTCETVRYTAINKALHNT